MGHAQPCRHRHGLRVCRRCYLTSAFVSHAESLIPTKELFHQSFTTNNRTWKLGTSPKGKYIKPKVCNTAQIFFPPNAHPSIKTDVFAYNDSTRSSVSNPDHLRFGRFAGLLVHESCTWRSNQTWIHRRRSIVLANQPRTHCR